MKRTFYIFFIVVVALSFVSCGLKVPSKVPEKVSVKYTKYLEFPITTFDFKMNTFIDDLLSESNLAPLNILRENPVKLTYATEVVYSPETLLSDVENQIRSQLDSFGQNFSFELNTDQFLSELSGQITLPNLASQSQQQEIDISSVDIPDITVVENQGIYNIPANGSLSLGSILRNVLPFDEGNFKEAVIELTHSGNGGPLSVSIDGIVRQVNQTISLAVKKDSTVTIKNTGSETADGTITIKLKNLKLDYFKNLDLTKADTTVEHSFSVDIPLENEAWYAKLGGKITQQITITGFSGNLNQQITVKSGTIALGSGNSNSNTLEIPLAEVYFKVGDGIKLDEKVTLSGTISADFRTTKPKVTVTPQVTLKAIKDYEITLSVPLPNNVSDLKFTSSSGYMEVNLTGLDTIQATTTFGSNTSTDSVVKIPFANVSLPSNVDIILEANMTDSAISYQAVLPDGQDIIIETATVSGDALQGNAININYPIPDDVKNLVDSLYATAVININYKIKGINGLTMDISSNFFDIGVGNNISFANTSGNEATHTISANNKKIDFATFGSFTLEATPSTSGDITLNNINLKDGAFATFQPQLETFEVDKVNLKGQAVDLPSLANIDLSKIFTGDSEFLRKFDYIIHAPISFDITNSDVEATLTLTVTDKSYIIEKGEVEDIGNYVEELINAASPLTLSAKVETGSGELGKTSAIKCKFDLDVPFSISAQSDIVITQGPLPGDLSILKDLATIIDKATLKFKSWNNTTGLAAKIVLENSGGQILSGDIGTVNWSMALTPDQMRDIAAGGVTYKILVPEGQSVSLNYNGAINAVPYIAVDLKVATEVRLGNKGE